MKKILILVLAFLALSGCNDIDRSRNDHRSSIKNVNNCNVKDYDPNADCEITKFLEENTISGYTLGGVNFCSYTILNDSSDENPLYLLVGCDEYYPLDNQLELGEGYCCPPTKITISEDGTMSYLAPRLGYSDLEQVFPEDIMQKYLSKEYDNRRDWFLWNAVRAEKYFNLEVGDNVKKLWWWEE